MRAMAWSLNSVTNAFKKGAATLAAAAVTLAPNFDALAQGKPQTTPNNPKADTTLVANAGSASAGDKLPPPKEINIPFNNSLVGDGERAGTLAAMSASDPKNGGWMVFKIHTDDKKVLEDLRTELRINRRLHGDKFSPAIIRSDGNPEVIEIYDQGFKLAELKNVVSGEGNIGTPITNFLSKKYDKKTHEKDVPIASVSPQGP